MEGLSESGWEESRQCMYDELRGPNMIMTYMYLHTYMFMPDASLIHVSFDRFNQRLGLSFQWLDQCIQDQQSINEFMEVHPSKYICSTS